MRQSLHLNETIGMTTIVIFPVRQQHYTLTKSLH